MHRNYMHRIFGAGSPKEASIVVGEKTGREGGERMVVEHGQVKDRGRRIEEKETRRGTSEGGEGMEEQSYVKER